MAIKTIYEIPWYTPGDDTDAAILYAARRIERLEAKDRGRRQNMARLLRRVDIMPEYAPRGTR